MSPHEGAQAAQATRTRQPITARILMVTPRYFPFSGGVETHVHETARRLVQQGLAVTILTTDPDGRLAPLEEDQGIAIRRVRAWPANVDYYAAPDIYRVIREGHWDLIHCQGYHTLVAPLAMLAALRANLPYVVTFHSGGHSSGLRNALRGVQQALLRPLLRRAARLVAVSKFEAALFQRRLGLPEEQLAVIPNGSQLPPSTRLPSADEHAPTIVSIGRLEEYKGHHRVLAALPALLALRPDVRLRIVGAGPYEAELRRMAAVLGVADRVEIGAIASRDRSGVADVLSRAAVVTLLSEYESQGIAVMEALALGRPVLVAATSALNELAERGLARAIPLESSAEAVAGAILDLIERAPTPAPVLLPSWDGCAVGLRQLYEQVLRSRNAHLNAE